MTTFAFLLGSGRCGSSLVHEVLARHPDVGFVSNVDDRFPAIGWGGRWNRAVYHWVPPAWTRKGRARFAPSEAYRLLGRRVSPAVVDPVRDLLADDATPWLTERFRRFFVERAAAQEAPLFLHKFTGWPRAAFIERALPEVRFIHVIRDGRAVASSLLQMPWWRGYLGPERWGWGPLPDPYAREWASSGRSFVLLAGIEWKLLMDAFDRAKEAVGAERWLDVRYEDVVADPRGSFGEILRFLDLRWDDGFERGFSQHAFRVSRIDAYREELSDRDVEMLERSLENHLERSGYPTTIDSTGKATA
jgi:hypothetical protein